MDESQLREIIRKVVAQQSLERCGCEKYVDQASGVIAVRGQSVEPAPFDTGKPGDNVRLRDVLTLQESPRLGCGIMEMRESCFDWALAYDEIDYVICGRLEILVGDRKMSGEAGDILFIPKGSAIRFSAPQFARFFYVTYPADWQNAGQS